MLPLSTRGTQTVIASHRWRGPPSRSGPVGVRVRYGPARPPRQFIVAWPSSASGIHDRVKRSTILWGVVAMAFLLVACGRGKSTGNAQVAPTRSPPPPPTTATLNPPASSIPTSSVPASPTDPGRCLRSELAATDDGGQGAGGTYFGRIAFRNISQQSCHLEGFPGLLRLDGAGQPRPTTVTRRGIAGLVNLAPQGYASFAYSTSNTPFGDVATCPAPAQLEVTPPDALDNIVVTEQMPDCSPVVQVSAVLPDRIGNYSDPLR